MGQQWSTMGKTNGRRRASPKQKQTKEQVPQSGFKKAHVFSHGGVNNDLRELWHLGGLLTFIRNSLFVDNPRAFLSFT